MGGWKRMKGDVEFTDQRFWTHLEDFQHLLEISEVLLKIDERNAPPIFYPRLSKIRISSALDCCVYLFLSFPERRKQGMVTSISTIRAA